MDRLVLPAEREILLGRDPECDVRYHETDDLVSRKHLKIVATREQPARYMIVDLGSRNGTFVNRQRVFGSSLLTPGERVQLGPGGPEFEFSVEAVEEHPAPPVSPEGPRNRAAVQSPRVRLARRTLVVLLPVAASAAGYAAWARVVPLWRGWRHSEPLQRPQPEFVPASALASIAAFEVEWHVSDRQTGARVARACVRNERASSAECVPLVDGASGLLPAFVLTEDRRIEPLLVPEGSAHAGPRVAGKWTAKGVIVPGAGAAVTAAPRERPWNAAYLWPAGEPAGALLVVESDRIKDVVPLAASQFPRWFPAESGWFAEQLPDDFHGGIRGRAVSRHDLGVEVSAGVAAHGAVLKLERMVEGSGLLFASVPYGFANGGSLLPPIDDGSAPPYTGQPVWVVAGEVEAAEISGELPDGALTLRSAACGSGGVVFDAAGRVLALCVPGADSNAGSGVAVRLHHGIRLPNGVADGEPR